jgi:mono/diheme cytochrome c family protein
MTYFFKLILSLLASMIWGQAWAVELPPPNELMSQYSLTSQKMTVVEPHESTRERSVPVDYMAIPIKELLTQWFGDRGLSDDAEIVFFAKDGYRSVIAARKIKQYRAFLAFARADGSAFVIDNPNQNEKQTPLGPYYLIWDNLSASELLQQGAYDWPYQITAVERHSQIEDQALLSEGLSRTIERGFEETREYCLTCHSIRNIGGKKYPVDLIQAICRWQKTDLKDWIDSPNRIKPGTSMPAVARMQPVEVRQQIIERIADYLKTMQSLSPQSCSAKQPE